MTPYCLQRTPAQTTMAALGINDHLIERGAIGRHKRRALSSRNRLTRISFAVQAWLSKWPAIPSLDFKQSGILLSPVAQRALQTLHLDSGTKPFLPLLLLRVFRHAKFRRPFETMGTPLRVEGRLHRSRCDGAPQNSLTTLLTRHPSPLYNQQAPVRHQMKTPAHPHNAHR